MTSGKGDLLDILTNALVPSSTSRKSWRRTATSVKCMMSACKCTGKGLCPRHFSDFRSQGPDEAMSNWKVIVSLIKMKLQSLFFGLSLDLVRIKPRFAFSSKPHPFSAHLFSKASQGSGNSSHTSHTTFNPTYAHSSPSPPYNLPFQFFETGFTMLLCRLLLTHDADLAWPPACANHTWLFHPS